MKYVRFEAKSGIKYGVLDGKNIRIIEGSVFSSEYSITDKKIALDEAKLLAPCEPGQVICVGLNYKDHADEVGFTLPEKPLIFLKSSKSLNHPDGMIKYPSETNQIEFEGELAVVIKKEAKNISAADAYDYILGYTCANDITARDIQRSESQWMRSKSYDTFMPLGPCISTDIDPNSVRIRSYLNGEKKQDCSTAMFIHNVPTIVEFVTRVITLCPGDVILTGSPQGTSPMQVGDRIKIEIEGIGELSNLVVADEK